jgi:hypothetical protein
MNSTELGASVMRIRKIIQPIAQAHSKYTQIKCPAPVWDATGTMIGVVVAHPVTMGGQACQGEASFVVAPTDDDAAIAGKMNAAINALKCQLLVSIKPLKREKSA